MSECGSDGKASFSPLPIACETVIDFGTTSTIASREALGSSDTIESLMEENRRLKESVATSMSAINTPAIAADLDSFFESASLLPDSDSNLQGALSATNSIFLRGATSWCSHTQRAMISPGAVKLLIQLSDLETGTQRLNWTQITTNHGATVRNIMVITTLDNRSLSLVECS